MYNRVLEGNKVMGAVRRVLKGRTMSWGVKKSLYQQVIIPTSHGHIWRGNLGPETYGGGYEMGWD